MTNIKFTHSLMAIVLGAALVSGSVLAEGSLFDKAANAVDSTRAKIDNSIKEVDNYVDDSTTTAKVKSALVDDNATENIDISVKTEQGVVTLSGFVSSKVLAERAVEIAAKVTGVKSVDNKLHVKEEMTQSVKSFADDTAITSELKARLLADDIVPSRKVKVKTSNGAVLLSGEVKNQAQSDRAEGIAKAIDGVKSVTNDLVVKP